jgi:hypothetical protein
VSCAASGLRPVPSTMRPATSIWLLAALVACQAQPAGVTQTEWELIQRWVTCGHCIGPPDALSAEALRDSVAGLGPDCRTTGWPYWARAWTLARRRTSMQ